MASTLRWRSSKPLLHCAVVPKGDSVQRTSDVDPLIVGYVRGPKGKKGEIKIEVQTDFPDRFELGRIIYIDGRPLTIERSQPHKNALILKLVSVDTIDSARQLQGKAIEIPLADAHVLPEGEYYRFQLLGLDVISMTGEAVGRIIDVLPTASNDVYVARGPLGEILIPATEDVIKSIDLSMRQMRIEIIDGLLPK